SNVRRRAETSREGVTRRRHVASSRHGFARRLCATMLRDASLVTLLATAACDRDAGVLHVSGTVEIRELQLAPLASGRLVRLLKDEGDTVHRGDTIAVLEQPGLEALINQRRAQAEAAAARASEIAAAVADSQRAANDLRRAAPL